MQKLSSSSGVQLPLLGLQRRRIVEAGLARPSGGRQRHRDSGRPGSAALVEGVAGGALLGGGLAAPRRRWRPLGSGSSAAPARPACRRRLFRHRDLVARLRRLVRVKIAPAAMFSDSSARQVPSTAPRILFSSNESIADRLRERGTGWIAGASAAARRDTRFASPLATRITGVQHRISADRPGRGRPAHRTHGRQTSSILIPARMASTRLPGKPLADIAGEPMIVHVCGAREAAASARSWSRPTPRRSPRRSRRPAAGR